MNELAFTNDNDGTAYLIKADGTFTGTKAGNAAVKGTWAPADPTDKKNRLSLTSGGKTVLDVPVTYAFKTTSGSSFNLLDVKVAASIDAKTPAARFGGQIKISQAGEITYVLESKKAFRIIGTLAFTNHFKTLEVTTDEGVSVIIGETRLGISASGKKNEKDLLRFTAVTIWTDAAGKKVPPVKAEIEFNGSLAFEDGKVRFIGSFDGKQSVNLILAGKYKFGSAGLQIGTEDGNFEAALETRGSFNYKGSSGTWDVALGYSERSGLSFSADLGFVETITTPNGSATLSGTAKIKYGQGKKLEVAVEFGGEISVQANRKVIFKIFGSNVGGKTSFGLKGTALFDGKKLTFALEHGAGKTTIQIAYEGEKLTWSLSILRGTDTTSIAFTLTFKFKDDELLPGTAKPITNPANN